LNTACVVLNPLLAIFMSKIILETLIISTPEICYKLSLNVDLHKLSTSKTGEYIIDGVREGIMKLNDIVTWRAKHFGIWQNLTTKITETKPHEYFVDEMQKGAFKSMKHEHHFVENEGNTIMKDVFDFTSPLGILGVIFNKLILENYMRGFLIERNQLIKQIAESDNWQYYVE
jgi:ligand-binding SRPBCC domain-containing protein